MYQIENLEIIDMGLHLEIRNTNHRIIIPKEDLPIIIEILKKENDGK